MAVLPLPLLAAGRRSSLPPNSASVGVSRKKHATLRNILRRYEWRALRIALQQFIELRKAFGA
jgi:hypothetical protein